MPIGTTSAVHKQIQACYLCEMVSTVVQRTVQPDELGPDPRTRFHYTMSQANGHTVSCPGLARELARISALVPRSRSQQEVAGMPIS